MQKNNLDDQGLSYKEAVVTNSSEVQQAAQSLAGEVDAIFVPNDSVIQSAMPMVTEVARDAKIPVYGSSAVMVDSGAFATIAISDTEIGAQTADMALEYLNGTAWRILQLCGTGFQYGNQSGYSRCTGNHILG